MYNATVNQEYDWSYRKKGSLFLYLPSSHPKYCLTHIWNVNKIIEFPCPNQNTEHKDSLSIWESFQYCSRCSPSAFARCLNSYKLNDKIDSETKALKRYQTTQLMLPCYQQSPACYGSVPEQGREHQQHLGNKRTIPQMNVSFLHISRVQSACEVVSSQQQVNQQRTPSQTFHSDNSLVYLETSQSKAMWQFMSATSLDSWRKTKTTKTLSTAAQSLFMFPLALLFRTKVLSDWFNVHEGNVILSFLILALEALVN